MSSIMAFTYFYVFLDLPTLYNFLDIKFTFLHLLW